LDVIKKAKGPIFWTDAWDTSITGLNGNRYSFRWDTPISNQFEAVLNGFLKLFPETKKGMNIQIDHAAGYDATKTIERVFQERGIQLLKNQFIPPTATDVSVFVNEAKASGADLYIVGLYGKIFGTALMQCKEFGLSKVMKVLSATGSIFTLRGVGSNIIQGMYFGDHWNHSISNEWSRSYTEKYKKRWGVIPGAKGAAKYVECQLMERVITQTGSADPKVLIPALENLGEFDGPTGKEHIAPWQHQVIHDFLVLRGKAPSEKKYEDDYVEVIGKYRVSPKQGDKGFEFDRTKEPL
jgi:branched-chain amino acid transport system substrate-binding protein